MDGFAAGVLVSALHFTLQHGSSCWVPPLAVGAAAEALDPYYQDSPSTDPELGSTERALLLLSSGLSWLHQGEWLEAKQRLGKALTAAHKELVNHQLVSQVMLFMMPAQLQSEVRQGPWVPGVWATFNLVKNSVVGGSTSCKETVVPTVMSDFGMPSDMASVALIPFPSDHVRDLRKQKPA